MSEERFYRLEKRFDKVEEMMTMLIKTVGQIVEEQTAMRSDIKELQNGQNSLLDKQTTLESDFTSFREIQVSRNKKMMEKFKQIKTTFGRKQLKMKGILLLLKCF